MSNKTQEKNFKKSKLKWFCLASRKLLDQYLFLNDSVHVRGVSVRIVLNDEVLFLSQRKHTEKNKIYIDNKL